MTRALLRMDWVTMRGYLLIALPFYLGNAVLFGFHSGVYMGGHAGLAITLMVLTLLAEHSSGTLGAVASLPVSRRHIVVARYSWAATLLILCYGLGLLYNLALTRWIARFAVDSSALVSPLGALGYATPSILGIGILLPLYYRHGLGVAVGGLVVAGLIGLTSVSAVVITLSGSTWRHDSRAAMLATLGSAERWMARSEIQVVWACTLVLIVAVSVGFAIRGLKAREL